MKTFNDKYINRTSPEELDRAMRAGWIDRVYQGNILNGIPYKDKSQLDDEVVRILNLYYEYQADDPCEEYPFLYGDSEVITFLLFNIDKTTIKAHVFGYWKLVNSNTLGFEASARRMEILEDSLHQYLVSDPFKRTNIFEEKILPKLQPDSNSKSDAPEPAEA